MMRLNVQPMFFILMVSLRLGCSLRIEDNDTIVLEEFANEGETQAQNETTSGCGGFMGHLDKHCYRIQQVRDLYACSNPDADGNEHIQIFPCTAPSEKGNHFDYRGMLCMYACPTPDANGNEHIQIIPCTTPGDKGNRKRGMLFGVDNVLADKHPDITASCCEMCKGEKGNRGGNFYDAGKSVVHEEYACKSRAEATNGNGWTYEEAPGQCGV